MQYMPTRATLSAHGHLLYDLSGSQARLYLHPLIHQPAVQLVMLRASRPLHLLHSRCALLAPALLVTSRTLLDHGGERHEPAARQLASQAMGCSQGSAERSRICRCRGRAYEGILTAGLQADGQTE